MRSFSSAMNPLRVFQGPAHRLVQDAGRDAFGPGNGIVLGDALKELQAMRVRFRRFVGHPRKTVEVAQVEISGKKLFIEEDHPPESLDRLGATPRLGEKDAQEIMRRRVQGVL